MQGVNTILTHADINMFDVVRLTDGKQGTVIEIYNTPLAIGYEIETYDKEEETWDMFTVTIEQIEEVIWKMPSKP